jgi:hypothetical protein
MRRTRRCLVAVLVLAATAGCAIESHGDSLPSAAWEADAEYHDPWHGIARPSFPSDPGFR